MIKGTILLFLLVVSLVKAESPVPTGGYPDVVPIISQESDVQPDGQYSYGFVSGDGTAQKEKGTPKVVDGASVLGVEGDYTYTDPEGNSHIVTYTADENGFQPVGDDIPQAPPIPEIIARALKYIEEHPYVEEKNT